MQGIACYMLDLQAMGYSESHAESPPQLVLDYLEMIADMEKLVEIAVTDLQQPAAGGEIPPAVKIILSGESLGGAL